MDRPALQTLMQRFLGNELRLGVLVPVSAFGRSIR